MVKKLSYVSELVNSGLTSHHNEDIRRRDLGLKSHSKVRKTAKAGIGLSIPGLVVQLSYVKQNKKILLQCFRPVNERIDFATFSSFDFTLIRHHFAFCPVFSGKYRPKTKYKGQVTLIRGRQLSTDIKIAGDYNLAQVQLS